MVFGLSTKIGNRKLGWKYGSIIRIIKHSWFIRKCCGMVLKVVEVIEFVGMDVIVSGIK